MIPTPSHVLYVEPQIHVMFTTGDLQIDAVVAL